MPALPLSQKVRIVVGHIHDECDSRGQPSSLDADLGGASRARICLPQRKVVLRQREGIHSGRCAKCTAAVCILLVVAGSAYKLARCMHIRTTFWRMSNNKPAGMRNVYMG